MLLEAVQDRPQLLRQDLSRLSRPVSSVLSAMIPLTIADSKLLPIDPLTPTASIPPSPSHSPTAEPDTEPDQFSFGPTFERVLSLVQRLDELQSESEILADPQVLALERLKAMDSIVEAVGTQVRVKYELVLSDVLASYVLFRLLVLALRRKLKLCSRRAGSCPFSPRIRQRSCEQAHIDFCDT